jgi:hypothetical protein
MEGSGRAGGASDGDEFEGVGAGASGHAEQHGQSDSDVPESRAMEGGFSSATAQFPGLAPNDRGQSAKQGGY